jgi:hypothetical protein
MTIAVAFSDISCCGRCAKAHKGPCVLTLGLGYGCDKCIVAGVVCEFPYETEGGVVLLAMEKVETVQKTRRELD